MKLAADICICPICYGKGFGKTFRRYQGEITWSCSICYYNYVSQNNDVVFDAALDELFTSRAKSIKRWYTGELSKD